MDVLADVFFPDHIISADKPRGRSLRRNDRVKTDGGQIAVNEGWTQSLREYEFATVPLLLEHWQEIEDLFEITGGGARGMLLRDPKDHFTTTDTGRMTLVSGSVYQLQRRYSRGAHTSDRKITRPEPTEFVPYYNGSEIVSYTLDTATGQVTLAAPVGNPALLSWEGVFYVPVHFMNDYIEWEVVRSGPHDAIMAQGPSAFVQEIRE